MRLGEYVHCTDAVSKNLEYLAIERGQNLIRTKTPETATD